MGCYKTDMHDNGGAEDEVNKIATNDVFAETEKCTS